MIGSHRVFGYSQVKKMRNCLSKACLRLTKTGKGNFSTLKRNSRATIWEVFRLEKLWNKLIKNKNLWHSGPKLLSPSSPYLSKDRGLAEAEETGAGSLSSLSVRGRDFLSRSFIDGSANLWGGEQRTQPEDTGGDKGCQLFPIQL